MKSLKSRLKNEIIMWRPAAFDVLNVNEWLIGTERGGECPSVVVMSDDRWYSEAFAGVAESYQVTNGDILSVRKVAEYDRIKDLTCELSMRDCDGGYSPEMGRAVEYEYTIFPRSSVVDNEIKVKVIFVVAESVEFFLKFLLPNRIEVETIVAKGYHIGFNACRSTGWWLPRAAKALGVEVLISDRPEDIAASEPQQKEDEALSVYPDLKDMPCVELPENGDSGLDDETVLWNLGKPVSAEVFSK